MKNLRKLFKLDTLEHIVQDEGADAARAFIARSHNSPMRLQPGVEVEFNYVLAELSTFLHRLPRNYETEGMAYVLDQPHDVWLPDTVIRSNRDLIEFHDWNNHCIDCQQQLTSCTCRDHVRLTQTEQMVDIRCTLKRLWFGGQSLIVNRFTNGFFETFDVRDQEASKFFPPNSIGPGFDHYIRDYHIRGPD